jgi:hypothetical protein
MFELLFIVALVAWLALSFIEFLASLPAAGTIFTAAFVVPLLAAWRLRRWQDRRLLIFLRGAGKPLPPQRFYWPRTRHLLGRTVVWSLAVAAVAWPVALAWPARTGADVEAIAGWCATVLAFLATSEFLACSWLYLRASQRFNKLKPGFIGWMRRGLYRLSDNHEFLAEEPLPRRKRTRESVY